MSKKISAQEKTLSQKMLFEQQKKKPLPRPYSLWPTTVNANELEECENMDMFKAVIVRKKYKLPYTWDGGGLWTKPLLR